MGAAEPPAHESHSATIRKLLKESGVDARPVRARLVGQLPRYSREPAKWANRDIHSKAEAQAVLDEVRIAIRAGTFDSCGQAPQEVSPMTVREFAEIYKERHAVTRKLSLADDRLGHPTDHGTVR